MIRPEKEDVIAHAEELGVEVILEHPRTLGESFLAGLTDLAEDDIVLFGLPDTLWEPVDGYRRLVAAVHEGADIALGLFRVDASDLTRSDVVVFGDDGTIERIEVKPAEPRSEWIWGCAAAPTNMWAGLDRVEWPGEHIDLLRREGRAVRGVVFSDVWLDIGTHDALQRARSAH